MDRVSCYAYVIEQAEDGHFWAYLPDLPGCTTTAEHAADIESQLQGAVEIYLSYYRERGLTPPTPNARVGTLTAA